jgi:hypothetical protein
MAADRVGLVLTQMRLPPVAERYVEALGISGVPE